MRSVRLSEAKDHLSEFVAAVEEGEEIVITRHGRPAARLVPIMDQGAIEARGRQALEDLARLRARLRAKGVTVTAAEMKSWKDEGRP